MGQKEKRPIDVVILSGMSGSGKSSALDVLEDAGYFAIDNLPGELFPELLTLLTKPSELSHFGKYALVTDTRERNFLTHLDSYLGILKRHRIHYRLLFFDTRDEVLFRRFSETRRKHPLAPVGRVADGIQKERDLLHTLRNVSTHVIDTSYLNVHELRRKVHDLLFGKRVKKEMSVMIESFGYRFGLPLEADIVLDLRFLPNPHFVDRLRPFSGLNPKVASFVLRQKGAKAFLKILQRMLALLLRQYLEEGKAYVTIAFGCTGGRHRSVAIAEYLGKSLKSMGYAARIHHRDLSRGE